MAASSPDLSLWHTLGQFSLMAAVSPGLMARLLPKHKSVKQNKDKSEKKVMEEKCSHLYEQLVILFHGHECAECRAMDGVLQFSALPVCHRMDVILSHMKYCQAGMSCQFPYCSFARVIVSHWKTCWKSPCPLIMNLGEDRKQRVQEHLQEVVTSFQPRETHCKILFKKLVLLFRDHRCDTCDKPYEDDVPPCHSVDAMLSHMKYCTAGMSCRFPGCPDARSIISHWKHCTDEDCLVISRLNMERKQSEHPVKKKPRPDLGFLFAMYCKTEMAKYQRKTLFVLYHVWNCIYREVSARTYDCDLPECGAMRAVLRHMEYCMDGSLCKFSECRSTSFIFTHYMVCVQQDCEICWPVRNEISQLCGTEETTHPPYWIREDVLSADRNKASWSSSLMYRCVRTRDRPLIGPPLFQKREHP